MPCLSVHYKDSILPKAYDSIRKQSQHQQLANYSFKSHKNLVHALSFSQLAVLIKIWIMQKFDFDHPVTRLSGDEFLPKPGLTFVQQILEYFQSIGGKALSPWGEVLLDKNCIFTKAS